MNEYLIKEETLDNIAIQSMNLIGKTEAVSTSTIISDLTNVNSEVATQTNLINQIVGILEGKAGGPGGNTDIEDAIISRTISGNYTNNKVSIIGQNAFEICYNLTSVNFPKCTTIQSRAFFNCSNLTSISFPVCTTMSYHAFAWCYSLTTADFPACTTIGPNAFISCRSLTTASFPVCTTIGSNAFRDCSSLTSASFPVCTTIGQYAFRRCSKLTTISFPACMAIGASAFQNCYNLKSLYLTNSAVCTLSNSNAFLSTPYAGYSSYFSGTPYIHVPLSLVDAYKTATNWTYYSSYFSAIVDTGGADNIG